MVIYGCFLCFRPWKILSSVTLTKALNSHTTKRQLCYPSYSLLTLPMFYWPYQCSNTQSSGNIKILHPPDAGLRKHTPFIGASILSCLGSFQNFVVGRSAYEETGISVFEKRCPWKVFAYRIQGRASCKLRTVSFFNMHVVVAVVKSSACFDLLYYPNERSRNPGFRPS